jgi:predicted RNA methylase
MRFRFTIRDLLWLTALLAMGLAWWVDHGKQVNRYQLLIDDQPFGVAYHIKSADHEAVLKALQAAFAGATDVSMTLDANTGKVLATAHPSQHIVIRELIDKIEGNVPAAGSK